MSARDTRPRYLYRLPDGRTVRVIHDHGETPKTHINYDIGKGEIVQAKLCGSVEIGDNEFRNSSTQDIQFRRPRKDNQ